MQKYSRQSNQYIINKNVNGTQYTYLYHGGNLMQETVGTKILDYFYDASGKPLAVKYRTNENSSPEWYYYALNSRGDVIGLYTPSGNLYCTYTYDVWGNILSVKNANGVEVTYLGSIVHLQSLKYRGYVYDLETGLYYLQSRYYDPVTHRFINADGLVSTGTGVLGYNMFAYCENNPSQYMDNGGNRYCEATSVNKESSHNRSISCPNYEKRERKVKIREAKATRDVINTILGLNCFTRTIGYSVSGSALLYGSYSKGIAFDREGNVALIESKMYGGGLVSISGSVFSAYSTAPTLNNLIGPSFQTGVSVDAEVSAGGEISVSQNGYMQYSGSVGLGLSPIAFEYHAGYSETKVLASFNIYDFKFTEALAFCNCILLGVI